MLHNSVSFYKRSLWVYNLTINDSDSKTPTKCYMWNEITAQRGGNEITSCVFKHIQNLEFPVKHVTCFSDCCSGQNKNKMLLAMYVTVMIDHPSLEIIDHKFLIPGHTHMECDSDHAIIEKAKKKE